MKRTTEATTQSLSEVMAHFSPARLISVIGGGGKTTLVHWLTKERAKTGRTLLTSTTAMLRPSFLPIDFGEVTSKANPIALFSHRLSEAKLKGIPPEAIDRLKKERLFNSIIVEADGSNGRPFKSYASYEPPIPQSSDLIALVIGADGFFEPIEQVVHRPQILIEQLGLSPDQAMTPEIFLDHFKCPGGALKNVPTKEVIVLFNRIDRLEDTTFLHSLIPELFQDERVAAVLFTQLTAAKLEAVYYRSD
ncbi:MAG TPA: putative selenium-dependent hydroxylase accessory protein YqeC [Tissierellia bacterium]|nr:putative selenium-dependent hydroxylase accessory protein YqeC [Tissierellia bacterium]